jgi:AcrR family transcriptional regulator
MNTAIQLADRDGLGELSMRRLAEELGITAMSLYGYVPSKAELLDVMADRAYAEIPAPGRPATPWQTTLTALAERHWALLLCHPWLLQIAASRPLPGPSLTAFYDAELAAVDGLGLTDVDMDLIVSLLDDYVRGAARGAVEAAEAHARTGVSDWHWWQTYGPLLAEVLCHLTGRRIYALGIGKAASEATSRPAPAPAVVSLIAPVLMLVISALSVADTVQETTSPASVPRAGGSRCW